VPQHAEWVASWVPIERAFHSIARYADRDEVRSSFDERTGVPIEYFSDLAHTFDAAFNITWLRFRRLG
jgi:hypothetical protein